MRSFLHDCWPLFAAFALATLCTVCFGADQKPLVINPTTGKQEQLQAANQLVNGSGVAYALSSAATIGGSIAANQVAYGLGANTIQGSNSLQYNGTFLNNAGYYQSTFGTGYGFYQTAARNEVLGARFENTSTGTTAYSSAEVFSDTAKLAMQAYSSTFASVPAFQNSGLIGMLNTTGSLYFYTNGATRQSIAPTGLITMTNGLTVNGATDFGAGLNLGATYQGTIIRDSAAERVRVGYKTGGVSTGLVPCQLLFTDTVGSSGSLGVATRDIAGAVVSIHAGSGVAQVAVFGSGGLSIPLTTDSTSVTTGTSINAGGQGVAKRSFLGTIGGTFKGNVLAGVQDGTADTAGAVGEVLSGSAASTAVAATGTVGNVCSVSLTPGAWMITGSFTINQGATGLTTGSVVNCSIVTTTATNGTQGTTMNQDSALLAANGFKMMSAPTVTANISASTTYYLTEQCSFTAGSPTVSGKITAVRIR